uniref:Glycerate kinase n=1 Tax=Caenorhabditis japonica TaxID=281687 RepID=A0A8R1HPY7_CAEJA
MLGRQLLREAFGKCIEAVQPRPIVRDAIKISADHIKIGDTHFARISATKIVLVAFGKASILMADGAKDRLSAPLLQKTLIIAPEQQQNQKATSSTLSGVFFGAKNNLPDENSVSATRHVISEIRDADSEHTIFLFLISGGGSALLCSPKPPVTLQEKLTTIKRMQAAGATIQELNIVRQKMSQVKGGRLLESIRKGTAVSLIISDVIGNPIELIASGPTVVKKVSSDDNAGKIAEIIDKLKIELPKSVLTLLNSQDPIATPATSNSLNSAFIISSNSSALHAATQFFSSQSSKFDVQIVTSSLQGNATEIGCQFADFIAGDQELPVSGSLPLALLFGGETTVKLPENPGKGGRNQEMVLACLDRLKSKQPKYKFAFLSAGTDGQDGPTDAAGAVITNEDLLVASPTSSESLTSSDSYNFWRTFNGGKCHVVTGPSGTNVMDVQILVLDRL